MINKKKKKLTPKNLIASALIYVALILFALWVLLPFSLVLLTSFKGITEANSLDFTWWPKEFTFQGYEKVIEYDMGSAYEGLPLIVSGFIMIFSEDGDTLSYSEFYDGSGSEYALLAVVTVVCIRSFVGKVVTPDFTLNLPLFALIALATALGKAAGGVVSKLVGVRLTTYISMIVAGVCLTLGCANEFIFILGVFAFNFSMPITLYYANILLKGNEGFAFGTLAAALTPGYFIASMFTYSTALRVCTALLCIASMLVIIIVSKRINKNANSLTVNHNN